MLGWTVLCAASGKRTFVLWIAIASEELFAHVFLFHAPPHFEYLRGVIRQTFSREITDRVATFAYYWCARAEAAAYGMEADSQIEDDSDDVILCPVCDPEWLGWYCMFCSLTVGE